ncbi:hypothetical protein X797_004843 [Metarhizium robertsii]|uniref:Uncharacterized protein n=1 Tax=Metarhizium robertsii TaxID=568076 RepID=A0A0A1UXG5_9HYPO|nr:hypothetical protein X797_004843 [Metarhizium robertsii]
MLHHQSTTGQLAFVRKRWNSHQPKMDAISLGYHVHRYQGFQASEPLSRAAPVAQRSAEQSRAEQSRAFNLLRITTPFQQRLWLVNTPYNRPEDQLPVPDTDLTLLTSVATFTHNPPCHETPSQVKGERLRDGFCSTEPHRPEIWL